MGGPGKKAGRGVSGGRRIQAQPASAAHTSKGKQPSRRRPPRAQTGPCPPEVPGTLRGEPRRPVSEPRASRPRAVPLGKAPCVLGPQCRPRSRTPRKAEVDEGQRKRALRSSGAGPREGQSTGAHVSARPTGAPSPPAHAPLPAGDLGTSASTTPCYARWKSAQWVGKSLAEVGLDLKARMMVLPGWLGDFCCSIQCTTGPTVARELSGDHRDLLPLPVSSSSLEEDEWSSRQKGKPIPDLAEKSDHVLQRAAGVKAWTWCLVASLNYMHAGRGPGAKHGGRPHGPATQAQQAALRDLESDVVYFLDKHTGQVPAHDWTRELGVRRTRYDGEEIGAAQPLSLRRMLPALPAKGHCGKICATDIATGQVRELLLDPECTLRPREEWEHLPLRAKCMHDRQDGDGIVEVLLDRGMCKLLGHEQVVKTKAGAVANGWFGVGKGKYLPKLDPVPENEILRFIMHFVPVNSLLYPIEGDVSCLPYFGQWSTLQLESWQYFAWSSEDIACMFYVFRIPEVWLPYMSFNCGSFNDEKGKEYRLCSTVLGMGWLSSVGVAQHLIRQRAPLERRASARR